MTPTPLRTSRNQFIKRSLVAREADIRKLDSAFKTFAAEATPEYSLECSDSLTRHFANVDEVVAFERHSRENSNERKDESGESVGAFCELHELLASCQGVKPSFV
jgi:hypothetical protein